MLFWYFLSPQNLPGYRLGLGHSRTLNVVDIQSL